MKNLKDKIIVVTGGANGMARELTIQLVDKGAKVVAVDIDQKGLKEVEDLLGKEHVAIHKIDLTNRKDVETLPKMVLDRFGAVDGIINNAGIIHEFVKVEDLNYETIERVMNINFYGTLNMIKTFLPLLRKRPEAHIANVASMGGFIPFPGQSIYSASKAAVKILTEALYGELKDSNIRFVLVCPAAVDTPLIDQAKDGPSFLQGESKMKKVMMVTPEEVVDDVEKCIEKGKQISYPGPAKYVSFMSRLFPKLAAKMSG